MIASGYLLQLYCDTPDPDNAIHGWGGYHMIPEEYTGELGSRCRQAARNDGWKLFSDGRAYCPMCNKTKK
jgi:hypothetical protein